MRTAGIIGGGAWGTALAQVCARAGLGVTLWAREPAVTDAINTRHENQVFLPGIPLDPGVTATLPGGRLVYGAARSRRPTPQTLTISLWVGLASFARSRQAWLSNVLVGPVL